MNRDILYEIMLNLDLHDLHQMSSVSTEASQIIHDKSFILNKFILPMLKKPLVITLDNIVKSYLPDRILLKLDEQDTSLHIQHFSGIYYKVLIWSKCTMVIHSSWIKYKNSTLKYDELIELLYHIYLYNFKLIQ